MGDSKKQDPKIVARYKDYEIMQGASNGIYYGLQEKRFVGHNEQLSFVISLISIEEGAAFDINKVEIL